MDVSPETKLNQQPTFSYSSFAGSSQSADSSSPSDFTCDLNKNYGLSHLPKEIPLKQLASGSPNVFDRSRSELKDSNKDCSSQDSLTPVYAVSITFAVGVTIALILHTYLGKSLVFVKGVLVSDHQRCTVLGQRVLHDGGSSVDAAITAALCLGVVHPHVSGVGGGGVMLVHDIHKNETRVINFQGAAPKTFTEEMLQNVSESKAGLHVGVPGMLRGLRHAHSLYGSLSWENVVNRAAAVAKEGFNVSFSLADALLKVKGEQLSQHFKDVFFPDGQALRPGSFLRMSSLAVVLEASLSNFYDGNISQEMEDEVQANGGVLSRGDISNYSVQVEQPAEGLFNDFIIRVPPASSAGAALISALKLVEGLHLNENNTTENQTNHWTVEVLKAALSNGRGPDDPEYNSSVTERLSDRLRSEALHQRISHSTVHSLQTEPMAGHVAVMGPDDLMVSVASSLSRPFGSRIITRSGVILNSLILDLSWTNKTGGQLSTKQKNSVQLVKRPLSSLMPTIVVPAWNKCGTYIALSSSGGQQRLSVITQVLFRALPFHKERNDSLTEFKEVQRVKTNSAVQGILRNKDIITALTLPQSSDSFIDLMNFSYVSTSSKGTL